MSQVWSAHTVVLHESVARLEFRVLPDWSPELREVQEQLRRLAPELAPQAWNLAAPHIRLALDQPGGFRIDGPGRGGRIIQVRRIGEGGEVLFRLDFHPLTHGAPPVLHYHLGPALGRHYVIEQTS